MLRLFFLYLSFTIGINAFASNAIVSNSNEIEIANKNAKPGDTIILKNGIWENITFKLNCKGNKENPIVFKAETKGKVFITGNSKLLLGGNYIVIDGFYFTKGYAGEEAVIKFSINNNEIGNNCRVTNTVINDFNNPKRIDENYWVALYGKNNRIDHCSFLNKKNLGVLLAVILEDDRSRANYHSIDHNYFGLRIPLASNGGEIIRVGVSEHCEFNSNTKIEDNYFEKCDGEAEIISIKSGENIVKNNLFKECQGAVVLRHGNYNIIENNVFLGNGKKGTGGVRVINKGHLIVNNFFYKCKGVDFRSPLSIMNGVPNSPAIRYVGVSDAVIANNSFYDCSPISFCEGSNTERSLQPKNVQFLNNLFYSKTDTTIYHIYDDISGIQFSNNGVNNDLEKNLIQGFYKYQTTIEKNGELFIPKAKTKGGSLISDSLKQLISLKLNSSLSKGPGYEAKGNLNRVLENAYTNCGAKWYAFKKDIENIVSVDCNSEQEITAALEKYKNTRLSIHLTNNNYTFPSKIQIKQNVIFTSQNSKVITFKSLVDLSSLFVINGSYSLEFKNLNLALQSLNAKSFVISDPSGSPNHSSFTMKNCIINSYNGVFFTASKSSLLDSILISNCSFTNGKGLIFNLYNEDDKKGYYNVENMRIANNAISNHAGSIIAILRSGKDESTLGPLVQIVDNKFTSIKDVSNTLVLLNGVQKSIIQNNIFNNCNPTNKIIEYKDEVRAAHIILKNTFEKSGGVIKNEFVVNK